MPAIPTSDMPGHRAVHDRVWAALDTCVETQAVDYKESAPWEALQFKIVKTSLGMGNLRDGGLIVVGASERGPSWELTGISADHLATYEVDKVVELVNRHASPPSVQLELLLVPYREGQRFLAVHVREFSDLPYVCRRDGPGLRQGALYLRPPGLAQTTEVRNAEEMHDLIDLAAEKRARRILAIAERIGLQRPAPERAFAEELKGL